MAEGSEDVWSVWLQSQRFSGGEREERTRADLREYRDTILDHAAVEAGDTVLDIGAGDGLIGFGALERVGPSGRVIFSDISDPLLESARSTAEAADVTDRCEFVTAPAQALEPVADDSVDAVTLRSVLVYIREKDRVFAECKRVLKPGGRISVFEPIHNFMPEMEPMVDSFLGYDLSQIEREVPDAVRDLTEKLQEYRLEHGPVHAAATEFDERDLFAYAEAAGFRDVHLSLEAWNTTQWETECWDAWLDSSPAPGVPTKREAINESLTPGERDRLVDHARPLVEERTPVDASGAAAYLWATCPGT